MNSIRLLVATLALLASWGTVGGAEKTHNFAVWEKAISAFERMNATNPPPMGGFEFVGSSTIARWKTLAQDFAGQPVFNRGFGGSEIVDATHFADRIILPCAPARIFFRAGGNDLAVGKSPEQVSADFQKFVALVHAKLPATEIYYISWSPTPLRWRQHEAEKALNGMVADFVRDKPYLKYIETYDLPLDSTGMPRLELFGADRLHFNQAGYRLLAARIRPYVMGPAMSGATDGSPK